VGGGGPAHLENSTHEIHECQVNEIHEQITITRKVLIGYISPATFGALVTAPPQYEAPRGSMAVSGNSQEPKSKRQREGQLKSAEGRRMPRRGKGRLMRMSSSMRLVVRCMNQHVSLAWSVSMASMKP
jgi:hypothetical protein